MKTHGLPSFPRMTPLGSFLGGAVSEELVSAWESRISPAAIFSICSGFCSGIGVCRRKI